MIGHALLLTVMAGAAAAVDAPNTARIVAVLAMAAWFVAIKVRT